MPRKPYWSVQTGIGELSPEPSAMAARRRGEDTFRWPAEPEPERVRIQGPTDAPYVVDVEFARDADDGEPVPIAVTVRRTFSTSARKQGGEYRFTEDAELEPIAAGDLREIPFGTVIRAALAAKRRPELSDKRHDELDEILLPRGRPKRGRSGPFYRALAVAADQYERRKLSPAKEIARRKGVSPNLVHQWLHVARQLEEKS